METIRADDEDAVLRASAALDAGGIVVLPGDLAYLAVADALDDDAIERLYVATGRGADEPLLVLLSGYEDLHHVAYGSNLARAAAERHWPGPATLLLKPRPWLPDGVTAGQPRVETSVPRQAFARELARQFGPLAACREGTAKDVALRVDAGALPGGSTTRVDVTGAEAKVIRDGGLGSGR